MAKNVLVDLGGLTKPAEILTNRVCDAIGGSFRPRQIRRVAQAEADAKIINAKSEIECKQLQEAAGFVDGDIGARAIRRMVEEEVKKQANIEEITSLAIEKLTNNAKPEDIDQDFITNLFDKCKNVSDEDMQSLWASLLAGEANKPGSFSKRTVALVDSLDRKDAILFSRFCATVAKINSKIVAISTPSVIKLLDESGISFEELQHLDTLGLIKHEPITGFTMTFSADSLNSDDGIEVEALYFNRPTIIRFENNPAKLTTGKILLTEAGLQLSKISGAEANPALWEAFISDSIYSGRWIFTPIVIKASSSVE